jgi:hypothetical protein
VKLCRAIIIPKNDACGKPATKVVIFSDDTRSTVCQPCSLSLQEIAQSMGSIVKIVDIKIGNE